MNKEDSITIKELTPVFEHRTSLLPEKELKSFVEYYFSRRDKYLGILKKSPPPVYVLETSVLKEKAGHFKKAFQGALPDVAFYYAVKSNNHPDVSKVLIESGFGLDVSSSLELEMALGVGARDIVFSGPGKTKEELTLAVMNSEKTVVLMDSFGELGMLERAAALNNSIVRAGVRLTTNPEGLWRKFGIVLGDLLNFWEDAGKCPHIRLTGLQFHSSWNMNPDAQIDFIEKLGRVLAGMPDNFRQAVRFIDIGGGYWPSQGEWLQKSGTPEGILQKALGKEERSAKDHFMIPAKPIEYFAEHLGRTISRHILSVVDCRICLEPGRWICNDAMHILISVIDKKAPDLVVTDAGTNSIGWERFETDYFPVLNLTRPSLKETPCDVLGSLCTPHDVWGYSYWGEDIQNGDILMIPTQGAYTYSLRQNFIKPLPELVKI